MEVNWPRTIPDRHRNFLISAIEHLEKDTRIAGVAAGGSFLSDTMDEFSDLDLVIVAEADQLESVLTDRHRIAGSLGRLLAGFTGEHVGEPRLFICLYDDSPILHVDLKFVSLQDVAKRVEDPCVLWERDGRFAEALAEGTAQYPLPNLQWIEDRFWVWIHYLTTKIARGELFEALDGLSFLRSVVLGPMMLIKSGARPTGVRKIEQFAPEFSQDLEATVATHNAYEIFRALRVCIDLYRILRGSPESIAYNREAEKASMEYLLEMEHVVQAHSQEVPLP
jgi:predicted nucleotidyltransferase